MKEIKMFMTASCPHCRRAAEMMDEIYSSRPEYRDIPLRKIDENKEADYASKFDYYYVPTFYVGDEKLHEGIPTKEAIEKVFAAAAER
ncbi:MAG: thioredoxin family protein [Synergistaceae bacterium]|jgi:glutaredoxin|nr:thioredoxin family protein [Synergistaceae bacterium]